MKAKKSLQSAFTAVLSASLVSSPVLAGSDFWDDFMDNSLLNVTQGGTVKYGNGRIFYTTSVYFRFGPAFERYEPIIEFSPPKVSFGCGGLSIKGMFIKILGLDRLSCMGYSNRPYLFSSGDKRELFFLEQLGKKNTAAPAKRL